MRKLFTRLISMYILIMVFVLQGFAQFPVLGPGSDYTNHKKTDVFVLTASEKVVPGTGVIRLKTSLGVTLDAYQATSSNVTITDKSSGSTVLFEISVDFTGVLEEELSYTLEADANFLKADDNAQGSSAKTWNVVTGDFTPPVLATTNPLIPANGATAIPLADDLTIKFNEPVQVAAGGQLFIYKDNGTPHGDLYEVIDASDVTGGTTTTLIINKNIDFKELQKYYVSIPDGAIVDFNVSTDNKNKFSGWLTTNAWAFTTRDVSAPTVSEIMADNIAATSFDVFTKLNEKGKVYVLAVANDATPVAADFITGKGMKVAEVTDTNVSVKVSLTQFFNGTTGVAMVTGTDYDVWVITETKDIPVVVSTPVKKLDVKTIDVTPPAGIAWYPANVLSPATDVNTKNSMYIVVNEDIKIGTGSIDVYTWSSTLNHTLLVSIPAASCTVKNTTTLNGDTLFIPVDKTLWASATTYYVKYPEGIVTDLAGNKLPGKTSTEDWKFTVKDFVAPTYTVVPGNGTLAPSEVPPQITITFNEALYKDAVATPMDNAGILTAILLKKGTSAIPMTVNSFDGKIIKLNIDPAAVASTAAFELSIDTKLFFDVAGNKGTTVDIINFSLKDYEGPVITSVKPPVLSPADIITINFNEPVLNSNGTPVTNADVANIVIFRKNPGGASGSIVLASYSVSADAKSFIIDPTNDFTTPGDQYFVRVASGALKDAAGNANVGKDTTLTVKDFEVPTAAFSGIGTSPVNPATVAPVITFNEAMETLAGGAVTTFPSDASALVNLKENGENVLFTATWGGSVNAPTISIAVTGGFKANKTYSISVGKSLQDVADNLFQGVATTFTTMSNAAPAKVSVTPIANATQQANDVAVEVIFDQNITLAVVPGITVSGSISGAVTVTPTVSGATLKIGHTAFVDNETVTIAVPAGAVIGTNTIPSAAVAPWSFKTKDTVKPSATYAPTGGGVELDAKLTITFNEEIVKKAGNVFIKDASNDVTVQTLSEANCVVKTDKKTLEITPAVNLEYAKTYYVVVTEGLVEDLAGNKNVAVTNSATWNFSTILNPGAFMVASSLPADQADKIAAGISPLTVTFNRDIKAGSASSTAKITVYNVTNSVIVISDAANTGRYSYTGNTLSINMLSDIVANKEYQITLEGGVFTDNYNTPSDLKTITFYTFDNNGPKVASHTPVKDSKNILTSSNIVINWDETPLLASDASAISAAAIKSNALVSINNGIGTAYTAALNGLQWTLTMDAAFAQKTLYTVTVAQTAVEDAGGTSQLPPNYTWSFTTIDAKCDAPVVAVTAGGNVKGTEVVLDVTNTQTDAYATDEQVKVYYAVVLASATPPTVDEIIALNKSLEYTANGTKQATVTGLTSAVAYKAYAVAVDGSANKSTRSELSFTTVDVIAPVAVTMVPGNGDLNIAANTTLVLTFDEKIAVGTGSVVIREVATDIIVKTVDIAGAGVTTIDTETGKIATINIAAPLGSKKEYYVEVSNGAVVDLAGNKWVGTYGAANWTFATKDTTAPLLVKTTPDYVPVTAPLIIKGSTLSIQFGEAMKAPTTGVVYVRYQSTGNVFEVINANGLTLSADMKTFSFSMMNVPVEQTEFWVDLDAIDFKDLADNKWDDSTFGNQWNFIIKDQTPPAIATIVPANNATGIVIGTNVVITFTEGIFKAPDATDFDGTAAKIKDVLALKDESGNDVAFNATIDAGRTIITITPTAVLHSETKYTVTISPVVDILKNVSGTLTSSFTTKDMTAPYVTMWNPDFDTKANPKTGVVTVTFNEPIYDDVVQTTELNWITVPVLPENIPDFFTYNVGTVGRDANGKINSWTAGAAVAFTGAISDDKKVITLTPAAAALPLGSEAWYGVFLKAGVVEDAAQNPNALDTTIFQIEDTEKPMATMYSPMGATADDAAMKIKFNEKIKLGNGNIYVRNYANGEVVLTIPVDTTTVTVLDSTATIDHADFPAAMNFYVNTDAGVFNDASTNMNPWIGIVQDSINTWKFSTADAVPPVITSSGLYPAPGATNVALNTGIEITFDKQIQLNTDAVTRWVVIYNEDWTPSQVIPVNSTTIELKPVTSPVYQINRVFSIKHANLQPNKKYYVRVMEGSATDLAGNKFAGIMDDSWYFSTEDSGAPMVVSLSPADNATAVDNNTNLVMTFNRNILANAAGMIKLYKEQTGSLGVLIETIDPTSASVTINEKVATIVLADALEYETGYYVIVEAGAFTNTAAEKLPFAGITTTQGWNFKTEQLVCDPIAVVITEGDQMECSAEVNLNVETVGDFVLTLNGDTIMAGDTVLMSGSYTVIAYSADGDCKDEKMFDVGSDPVVRDTIVETNIGQPVQFVDVESGIDTMLTVGVHTFTYDYMECVRTLIVTVVEEVITPTIAEIQGQGDKSPMEGQLVKVVATVSAVAPGEGFFMQDANAAWSGIWVEFNSATYEGIQIGNGVSVIGEVAEMANVTSIVSATVEFVPPMLEEVIPVILDNPSDLEAEEYESVLVKVNGATATAPAQGTGEWTIFYEEADNALVNDWLYFTTVVPGHYYDVTGVVNARLDNYKLEPRIEPDVKDKTITKVDPDLANAFKVYPNPFNDKITIDNSEKLSRVVVSNIAGQRVIDIEYPTREIRTANLVSGIYVISLYTESGIAKTERMIKR